MPNHLQVLIDFATSAKSINKIVSNGKRFMAYTIVERLKEQIMQIYFYSYPKL
jgi:ribosomal protein S7